MDSKKVSLLTLCDLSKVFDTVNLLNKCSLSNTIWSTRRFPGLNDVENNLKLKEITPLANFIFIGAMVGK